MHAAHGPCSHVTKGPGLVVNWCMQANKLLEYTVLQDVELLVVGQHAGACVVYLWVTAGIMT